MSAGFALDGPLSTAVLVLPWILLALAALLSRLRRKPQPPRITPVAATDGGANTPTAVGVQVDGTALRAFAEDERAPDLPAPASADAVGPKIGDQVADVTCGEAAASLTSRAQEELLIAAIEKAKAQKDDETLSGKTVELARLLLLRAQRPQAATLLQSAALVARRANLPLVHAEARIELAELAHGEGDMTSACEHWQIAKLMFHDAGRRQERDRVAELMRQRHCPTDWVLTNF